MKHITLVSQQPQLASTDGTGGGTLLDIKIAAFEGVLGSKITVGTQVLPAVVNIIRSKNHGGMLP